MKTNKIISNAVLTAMLLQGLPLSNAFAAEKTIELTEEAFRSKIAKEIEENLDGIITDEEVKKYEAENPDVKNSFGDRMLRKSSAGMKKNIARMLTDFKVGVKRASELAYNGSVDGNNVPVVIGVKDGWKMLKKYGKAAGVSYVDSIRYLPKHLKEAGGDFKDAGQDIGALAKKNAKHSAEYWNKTAKKIKEDAEEAVLAYTAITDWAKDGYKDSATDLSKGVKKGAKHSVEWSKRVLDWTIDQEKIAFNDLKTKPLNTLKNTGKYTKNTFNFFKDATVNTLKGSTGASAWLIKKTGEWTKDTYNFTMKTGKTAFQKTNSLTKDYATWIKNNSFKPLTDHMVNGVKTFTHWNMKKGYHEGLKKGFKTAGDAYANQDYLMGTIWSVAGVGLGVMHILVLEPTVVPLIAAYGVAGSAALTTVGYPSIGAAYGIGLGATGLTYATGLASTAGIATLGTVGAIGASGLGVVGTTAVAGAGVVSTVGTAVGGTTLAGLNLGLQTTRVLGTPVVGGIGMVGAFSGGVAEMLGASVYNGGKMVGITGLTAGGYGVVSAYEATKIVTRASIATGVTVFDNAIMTPVGTVVNLAQAIGTGSWRILEDPVKGTLNLAAATGVTLGTIVTSAGGFSYEFLKGTLKAMRGGMGTVVNAGGWIVGATAKVVEVIADGVRFKKFKQWGEFHRSELEAMMDDIEAEDEKMAQRMGEVELIRVYGQGLRKGKVKAFMTKNKETKERFFFKRLVNAETCMVQFKVTNKGPLTRTFSKKAYTHTYDLGLYDKVCDVEKEAALKDAVAAN